MFRRFRQRLIEFLRRWYYCLQSGRRQAQQSTSANASDLAVKAEDRTSRQAVVTRLNRTLVRSSALRPIPKGNNPSKVNNQDTEGNTQSSGHLDRPDWIKSLVDSAYVCECQGRFGEAERLYKQALTLSIRRFGETHLEIAPHLNNLSALYCLQKRYAEALPLLSSALKIRQQEQASNHPDIGEACTQLAEAHRHLQQYQAAEELLQLALEIFRKFYGPQHTRTKAAYDHLMQLIAIAIEAGKFDEISDEPPPLDLETLGETYSWAQPTWLKSREVIEEDYSWIKLFEKKKGRAAIKKD